MLRNRCLEPRQHFGHGLDVAGHLIINGDGVTPEELLLYAAAAGLERRGFPVLLFGLLRLQSGFDGGEVFGGSFRIARQRRAKYRLDRG